MAPAAIGAATAAGRVVAWALSFPLAATTVATAGRAKLWEQVRKVVTAAAVTAQASSAATAATAASAAATAASAAS